MEQKQKVKARIRSKFGTIRRFSEVAEIPEKDLRNYFSGKCSKSKIDGLTTLFLEKIESTSNKVNPKEVSNDDRKWIKDGIYVKFKSLREFCRKNSQFSPVMVSNVLTGRRKKFDKRVKEIIDILEV